MGLSDNAPLGAGSCLLMGEIKPMGNGEVWSWVVNDVKGKPSSIGITFTETALSGLAENLKANTAYPTVEYQLSLPRQAKVAPFAHIIVNWNPHGHIPLGI